jgi:hypothetical protein
MDPDNTQPENDFPSLIQGKPSDSENKKRFKPILMLSLTIFLLIGVLLILTKPALTGYVVSAQFEDNEMEVSDFIKEQETVKTDLTITKTNLDTFQGLNDDYFDELVDEKKKNFECEQNQNEIQYKYDQLESEYEFEKSKLEKEYEQKKQELETTSTQTQQKYNDLKTLYDATIGNAARNICCKAKVDNQNIDSYIISNSMIVCTSDGENKIIC